MVCEMRGKWSHSCCFVRFCFQVVFKTVRSIIHQGFVFYFPFYRVSINSCYLLTERQLVPTNHPNRHKKFRIDCHSPICGAFKFNVCTKGVDKSTSLHMMWRLTIQDNRLSVMSSVLAANPINLALCQGARKPKAPKVSFFKCYQMNKWVID